jgi:hypothetical protein
MSTTTTNTTTMNLTAKGEKKPRGPNKKKVVEVSVSEVSVSEVPVSDVPVSQVTLDQPDTQVDKKVRAPSLPAKYAKYIQFGYWFMQKLNENSEVPAVDENLFIEKLNVFGSIDDQQAFVQSFFDSSKDISNFLRQRILQRKRDVIKADKAAAKAAAKEAAIAHAMGDNAPAKKTRAPRLNKNNLKPTDKNENITNKPKGKKKILPSNDPFVNEMVLLANGAPETTSDSVNAESTDVSSTASETIENTPSSDPPTTTVPEAKKKNNKKVKASKPDNNLTQTQVSILNLPDGQQFLIDDLLNVYHFTNHNLIGKFDANEQTIIAI